MGHVRRRLDHRPTSTAPGAAEAWAAGYTGSRSVYVGVIDEGIQFSHPDLAPNIWTNPYDPVDGVDNDGNGYVDDVHGWDFYNNDSTVYDGSASTTRTATARTSRAPSAPAGNNGTGIAGINWAVTIVPAKFLGPDGGYVSDAIRALDYLTDLQPATAWTSSPPTTRGAAAASIRCSRPRSSAPATRACSSSPPPATPRPTTTPRPTFPSNLSCTEHANGTPRGYDCIVAVAAIDKFGRSVELLELRLDDGRIWVRPARTCSRPCRSTPTRITAAPRWPLPM